MMNNIWVTCSNARKIAFELQSKYFGLPQGSFDDPLVDRIVHDLWNHELNNGEMFLDVYWDDNKCLLWLQIGIAYQAGTTFYVPR